MKGIALTRTDQADHLLVIRLNNFLAIEAAFGPAAARGAMDHLCCAAQGHLGRVDLRRIERGEMTLNIRASLMTSGPIGALVDNMCVALAAEPFRCGEAEMLLSVSAGCAMAGDRVEDEARGRLAASTLPATQIVARSEEWGARYRKDMGAAVKLIGLARRGALTFNWRPVARPGLHGAALYHEAMLLDCADARAAIERLGLAHLIDRLLLSDVLDELESDPVACLSLAISTQSLSLNLHGKDAGWTDLFARLKRNQQLARRLVVEIADNSGMTRFRDALAFVQGLRVLGARISVARFGSGHASISQLKAIAPDVVKLDSPFMHRACHSERHRTRISQLLGLARTVSPMVIVDGIESPWQLRLAVEQGAEWVVGSHLKRSSQRRSWPKQEHGGAETDPIMGAGRGLRGYAAHIGNVGVRDGGLYPGHVGDAFL